ncbi:MAG TPA: 3TM-type holin [Rubrivivax sp.]|nr:3TM-type holin [Rubrivivax sp.]
MAAADPVTAVADLATTIIGRLWPDKTERERAQMAAALMVVQGQLDANRAEAASPSAFTSGWRPGIGWVCALALACQYIARPVLQWIGIVTGHPLPPLPGIDEQLWELMLGMLGLGGLRTVEKIKGAEGNR